MMRELESFPISFVYEGKPYKGFGPDFVELERTEKSICMQHIPSGIDFRLEVSKYEEHNAWDYTLYITNNSNKTSGVFSDINAIDIAFEGKDPIMKGIAGDCGKDMYKPYAIGLEDGEVFFRESVSGRPSHGVFPYFNLEYGEGGSFIAIGWPGRWKAEAKSDGNLTHFTGGQRAISTVLVPGETIRTPLIAILNYNGRDEDENINLWRRWFIECNMHKIDGKPMEPIFIDYTLAQGQSTETILTRIRAYADQGIPLDYFWLDAGWYTDTQGNTVDWPLTGSLMIDESRFPDHFKSISDELSKTGGKLLLWFEPEVVRLDRDQFLSGISDFDPEWMLGYCFKDTWLEGQLLDLGNPACRDWLTKRILKIIRDANISIYRQDFNVDPWTAWDETDQDDHIGYTENRYVMGYLTMWDELLASVPELRIDSCASGGGRNDLETMRRSIPFHISDYWDGNPGGYDERQATMMSVMQWFPYTKFWMTGDDSQGDFIYRARSCYTQAFPLSMDNVLLVSDWDLVRKLKFEWDEISAYYYSDFYLLTEWNNENKLWKGYQYFDKEKDSGFAQLFRPSQSDSEEQRIRFKGLDEERSYRIYDTDGTLDMVVNGRILSQEGIDIRLPRPLYAMVLHIKSEEERL